LIYKLVFSLERRELKASQARRKEKRHFYSKKVAMPTRMLLKLSPLFRCTNRTQYKRGFL